MRIDIMTLFPETVGDMMNESILGRAQERDHIKIECHQIRDYTTNKQNQVDDYPYGGGHGAVLAGRCAGTGAGAGAVHLLVGVHGCPHGGAGGYMARGMRRLIPLAIDGVSC